jgi:anti-sigma B factor antagonist
MTSNLLVVLQPQENLDSQAGLVIQQQIQTALQAEPKLCVIDMTHVKSVDSQGLLSLTMGFKSACEQQCRLVFCNLQPLVRIVFEISQLDRRVEIIDSTEMSAAEVESGSNWLQPLVALVS